MKEKWVPRIGQRVSCYETDLDGVIICVKGEIVAVTGQVLTVKDDEGTILRFHRKQCRRLVKKPDRSFQIRLTCVEGGPTGQQCTYKSVGPVPEEAMGIANCYFPIRVKLVKP